MGYIKREGERERKRERERGEGERESSLLWPNIDS